jgi:hypothetical protein
MKRILMALMICALSFNAFAAVNDIRVSGSIGTHAVTRDFSLGSETADDRESFIANTMRLRFDADLTEDVAAVIAFSNERLWGEEVTGMANNVNTTDTFLEYSYVTMNNFLGSPLSVTLGRTPGLVLGRGLIVAGAGDDPTPANSPLANLADPLACKCGIDGAYARLDLDPMLVDFFYFKASEGDANEDDDINVYGLNAGFALSEGMLVEAYYVGMNNTSGDTVGIDEDYVNTFGVRTNVAMGEAVEVFAEAALQKGNSYDVTNFNGTSAERTAYMLNAGGVLKLTDAMNTMVGAEYAFFSGDDSATDTEDTGWNQVLEAYSWGEIADYFLVNNTNVHGFKAFVSTMPREDLTLALNYAYIMRADANDIVPGSSAMVYKNAFVNSGITDAGYAVDSGEREFGQEIDLSVRYDYTEDVELGLVNAYFFPGDFFDSANDSSANSVRAYAKVEF